jgi:hypothetical protein
VPDTENLLPDDIRAALRAPMNLGAGARARVMHRVRTAARLSQVVAEPRGITRPSVVGALLAASFVAAIVTGGARQTGANGEQATLADTIAMHFALAAETATATPVIHRERFVAVADETRNIASNVPAATHSNELIRRD